MGSRVIICPKCDGFGKITEEVITDYHRGEYEYTHHTCTKCDGAGRLVETTEVTVKKLTR